MSTCKFKLSRIVFHTNCGNSDAVSVPFRSVLDLFMVFGGASWLLSFSSPETIRYRVWRSLKSSLVRSSSCTLHHAKCGLLHRYHVIWKRSFELYGVSSVAYWRLILGSDWLTSLWLKYELLCLCCSTVWDTRRGTLLVSGSPEWDV